MVKPAVCVADSHCERQSPTYATSNVLDGLASVNPFMVLASADVSKETCLDHADDLPVQKGSQAKGAKTPTGATTSRCFRDSAERLELSWLERLGGWFILILLFVSSVVLSSMILYEGINGQAKSFVSDSTNVILPR